MKTLDITDDARRGVLASVPMGRFAGTDEIAESAAFLLSDRAAYVTGDVLVADGGQWLRKAVYTAPR
jgi:NAD(P)-dependent dehydrogenase (short-subunit alcohol dehydrogenase family)